jgi:hypothetical protein
MNFVKRPRFNCLIPNCCYGSRAVQIVLTDSKQCLVPTKKYVLFVPTFESTYVTILSTLRALASGGQITFIK